MQISLHNSRDEKKNIVTSNFIIVAVCLHLCRNYSFKTLKLVCCTTNGAQHVIMMSISNLYKKVITLKTVLAKVSRNLSFKIILCFSRRDNIIKQKISNIGLKSGLEF